MSKNSLWASIFGSLNKKQLTKSKSRSGRRLCFEQCEDRRMLAPLMVTNSDDAIENTPEAIGTLRQAIFDANSFPDADEIYFAASLDGTPIMLTQGELKITNPVTIRAAVDGMTTQTLDITIDAGNGTDGLFGTADGSRIFEINNNSSVVADVEIIGLTLTGGDPSQFGMQSAPGEGSKGSGLIDSLVASLALLGGRGSEGLTPIPGDLPFCESSSPLPADYLAGRNAAPPPTPVRQVAG